MLSFGGFSVALGTSTTVGKARFDFAPATTNVAAAAASSAALYSYRLGYLRLILCRCEVVLWPWHFGHNVICGICSTPNGGPVNGWMCR